MKIDITKKQYKTLLTLCGVANSVLGILSDELDDEQYKKLYRDGDQLQEHIMSFSQEMGGDDWVEKYNSGYGFKESVYQDEIVPIMEDYDEHTMLLTLASRLASRDFQKQQKSGGVGKSSSTKGPDSGANLYECEQKYWEEFEAHGVERLEIRKM